jgi:hypothetical protein
MKSIEKIIAAVRRALGALLAPEPQPVPVLVPVPVRVRRRR